MDRYQPPSDFLKNLIEDDGPLSNDDTGENLHRLIALTRDELPANRDWATFLLAGTEIDTPEVRDALEVAAEDENEFVRSEAILGIAYLDTMAALPLLQRELARESVAMPTLEAAALVAHPSLVSLLQPFTSPSDLPHIDELVLEALRACETGRPAYDR